MRTPSAGGSCPRARSAGSATATTARPNSTARTPWPLMKCKTRVTYQTVGTQTTARLMRYGAVFTTEDAEAEQGGRRGAGYTDQSKPRDVGRPEDVGMAGPAPSSVKSLRAQRLLR